MNPRGAARESVLATGASVGRDFEDIAPNDADVCLHPDADIVVLAGERCGMGGERGGCELVCAEATQELEVFNFESAFTGCLEVLLLIALRVDPERANLHRRYHIFVMVLRGAVGVMQNVWPIQVSLNGLCTTGNRDDRESKRSDKILNVHD